MKTKVLVVVDYQNDFLPGGALAVKDGDKIVTAINRVAQAFKVNVFTRDWHPIDHCSFAKEFSEYKDGSWPIHCVQDTNGAQISPNIDHRYITKIFNKGMDKDFEEYSGASGNNEDGAYLWGWLYLQVEDSDDLEVYVAGLATDYCVQATVLDLIDHGFKTYLLVDAVAAVSEETGEIAMDVMKKAGAIFTTTFEAISHE